MKFIIFDMSIYSITFYQFINFCCKTSLLVIIFKMFVLVASSSEFKFGTFPVTGQEQAVLVLVPGTNTNGNFFLTEKLWVNFAKKNKLGLLTINFSSDIDGLYGFEKKGYYWPEQGSGNALNNEIKRVYGKDLPILIYGFSGGAQFVSRYIDFSPSRIIAWCAYSAQFWDNTKALINGGCVSRGIVACGDLDGARWQPSFSFYYDGKKQGKEWIWISCRNTRHNRNAALEEFVRAFFKEELDIFNGKEVSADFCVNFFTMETAIFKKTNLYNPTIISFRNIHLYMQWKDIHIP